MYLFARVDAMDELPALWEQALDALFEDDVSGGYKARHLTAAEKQIRDHGWWVTDESLSDSSRSTASSCTRSAVSGNTAHQLTSHTG